MTNVSSVGAKVLPAVSSSMDITVVESRGEDEPEDISVVSGGGDSVGMSVAGEGGGSVGASVAGGGCGSGVLLLFLSLGEDITPAIKAPTSTSCNIKSRYSFNKCHNKQNWFLMDSSTRVFYKNFCP